MTDLPATVVFLDIDGPMIPDTMLLAYRMASFERRFPPTTIAVLNFFCERSGAAIVFNTTHNTPITNVADIEIAIANAGVERAYFHPTDLKTSYPAIARGLAVKEWLARHPEVTQWVAFDDVHFTDENNLILVDPDPGLTCGDAGKALLFLRCAARLSLLI